MIDLTADVGLLAPVPKEHLLSGLKRCQEEGFAAFGTDAGLVLSELKHLVDENHPAGILFYASHSTDVGLPMATFRGRFVDYDGAVAGKAKPAWTKYRPESTAPDTDWSSFYLVTELCALDLPVSLATLRKRNNKGKFSKTFLPHGPIIIETPF